MIKGFDLNSWELFSERRNSKSYKSSDGKWMVKFDTDVTYKDVEELEKERGITLRALEIGIKTPKVGDIVELADGTHGLIYEYIMGKKSITRAISEDVENYDYYMKRFVHIAKDFHSKVCNVSKFTKVVDVIRKYIKEGKLLNDSQQEKANVFLDSIEDKNTALHGDFHPGNFIITDKEEYAIDLGAIKCGNPIFDIGFFYFFVKYMPNEITSNIFHVEKNVMHKMWESFAKYYFEINNTIEMEKVNNEYDKYALIAFMQSFSNTIPGPELKVIYDKHFDKVFA